MTGCSLTLGLYISPAQTGCSPKDGDWEGRNDSGLKNAKLLKDSADCGDTAPSSASKHSENPSRRREIVFLFVPQFCYLRRF